MLIKKRFTRLNRDEVYRAILDSQLGAHCKQIPNACLPKRPHRTFLADKLRYMLKSPKCGCRIFKTHRVTADGECVPCFRQKKSELRKRRGRWRRHGSDAAHQAAGCSACIGSVIGKLDLWSA
jgi:hypothetical protein